MTPFDAVGQALSVVALGGFSTRTVSIAAFAPITQYVILVFMVIAGINFLRLYRFFVQRRVDVLAKDEELRLYLALILIGTTLIAIEVIGGGYETGEAGIRHASSRPRRSSPRPASRPPTTRSGARWRRSRCCC